MIRRYKYRSLKKLQLHKNSVFLLEIRDTKQVTALLYYCITIVYSYDLLYFQRTEHMISPPPHLRALHTGTSTHFTARHGASSTYDGAPTLPSNSPITLYVYTHACWPPPSELDA